MNTKLNAESGGVVGSTDLLGGWLKGWPPDSTTIPFWAWGETCGVVWVYWAGGCNQIDGYPYPPTFHANPTHYKRAYPLNATAGWQPGKHPSDDDYDHYWYVKPNSKPPEPPNDPGERTATAQHIEADVEECYANNPPQDIAGTSSGARFCGRCGADMWTRSCGCHSGRKIASSYW